LGLVCLALVTASGCAVDNRTGARAAAALLETEVRSFAAEQAQHLAQAAVGLHRTLTALAGPELPAARGYWQVARGSYDQASTVCLLLAPALDLRLDGRFDNPLALGGLRQLERALFAQPRADDATLQQLAQAFRDDSLQLPGALSDTRQPLDPAQLLTTMSAVVAVVGTKADGSDSPYAGTAHLAIQNNLSGLQHMYTVLSPLVRAADAALDAQVLDLFAALQQQVAGLSTVDALVGKVLFLRRCAELSQALLRVNTALGLVATAAVDVT
jgi:iron uptake system EfeUOB component EfeO/EfeM